MIESETKKITPDPSERARGVEDTIAEEKEDEEEETADDKKLISDFFADEEPLELVRFVEAEYTRRWEREALVSQSLYVPGSSSRSAEEKLRGADDDRKATSDAEANEEGLQPGPKLHPRDWESEGFFVGVTPYVTLSNRNKMESRLLTEPEGRGRKWFCADGKLDAAPLPLKTFATRPPIEVEDVVEEIETRYVEPIVNRELSFLSKDDIEKGHLPSPQRHLQIELRNLSFAHHPLFSEEHMLAATVEQLCEEYVEYSKKDAVGLKTLKIETLRRSIETIKDKLKTLKGAAAVSGTDDEIATTFDRLNARLLVHRCELKQMVYLRDLELKNSKSLTTNILDRWRALKTMRERSGIFLTGGKLSIVKVDAEEAKDRIWWEMEIAAAVEMKRGEFGDQRAKKMKEYGKHLEAWQNARRAVKEDQKRKKKKMKPRENEEEEALTEEEDLSVASAVDQESALTPKPIKPPLFDEDAAIATAVEFGRIHWRKPGDPTIRFEWISTGQPIAAENAVPQRELLRRQAVGNTKVFIRMLFNGKEVVKTPPKALTGDFVLSLNSSFQLRVNQSSFADLKLEVHESSSFASSSLIAELFAPLPDSSNSVEETLQFSSSRVVYSKNGVGVGCGAPMQWMDVDGGENRQSSPLASGKLGIKVHWTAGDSGISSTANAAPLQFLRGANSSMTMMKRGDVLGAVGLAGISDKSKLRNWIAQDSNLDPNDPQNADLVQLMDEDGDNGLEAFGGNEMAREDKSSKNYFRLDHAQQEFDFCSEEELNSNPRFRLLEMRSRKIPEFRNLKMIPAFGDEIPATIFAPYENRIQEERDIDKGDEEEEPSDVDSTRRRMIRFLQKVKKQVADRFQLVSKFKTVKDVVIEEEIPNVSTLAASIYSLQARFARPLHPVRVPRKANVQGSNVPGAPGGIGPDVNVYANILRAFNLPTREVTPLPERSPERGQTGYNSNPFVVSAAASRFQRGLGADGVGGGRGFSPQTNVNEEDESLDDSLLIKPFVEVMFQRRTARTSTSEGPNASWNEELLLPFHPPNEDFSPAALQKAVDVIHVTLFDEVVSNISSETEEETSTTKVIHQRVVNKWLGCIKIPFSTLFFNGKIEGTFRVRMPSILLGYRKSKEGFLNDQFRSTGSHSYLHFYLTLDPALAASDPIRERFDSSEPEQLLRKADEFVDHFANRFPDRSEVMTTVINLQGKSVFVTRFVRPLTPPMDLMIGANWLSASSSALVARFVACIPNVSDSAFFAGICDLWSTCDQFLQMMSGDEEEHAVLLLNFFLAMGKSAWLVLGLAIPEGPTAYVLSKEGLAGDLWLWNPTSGVRYSVKDSFCPMTAIHSLINDQNIWLNVQSHGQPAQMNFDLSVTRDWSAFFGGKFLNPGLSSVQPEALRYAAVDETYVRSASEKLERSIRENLMRWRPKQITRWNRLCSQALEKVLPRFEESAGSVTESDVEHLATLEPLAPFLSSYSLTGFPLHSTCTDNAAILDAVYSTGIHNNAAADVEFALAVYIHAYPAHVLSVWVYVACLEKKRD